MTTNSRRTLLGLVLLLSLVVSETAIAGMDKLANVHIRSDSIRGECFFGLDELEPWAAINSTCETVHSSPQGEFIQLAYLPISGFQLEYPRNEYKQYRWETMYEGTVTDSNYYCQVFGFSEGAEPPIIELGHHSDPDLNRLNEPGHRRCKIAQFYVPSSISWGNNHFVYCHRPQCALWDMRAFGGAGADYFDIRRSFSLNGHYSTIQTESDISYFNVHGGDQNMYWKVCGINSVGETCSPAYRTRPECEVGGPDPY